MVSSQPLAIHLFLLSGQAELKEGRGGGSLSEDKNKNKQKQTKKFNKIKAPRKPKHLYPLTIIPVVTICLAPSPIRDGRDYILHCDQGFLIQHGLFVR